MKKLRMCCLLLFLSLFLAACGKDSAADAVQRPEWTYVPERIEINDEKVLYGEMHLVGDNAFYLSRQELEESIESRGICRYSFTDSELSSASIDWPTEIKNQIINAYLFTPDNSMWVLIDDTFSAGTRFLYQFDPDGRNIISRDVTKQLGRNVSVRTMAADGQGRIYVFADDETGICLYTEDGSYHGSVSYGSLENVQVRGTVEKEDGGLYVCVSAGVDPDHCILMEMDFEKRLLTEVTREFPKVRGLCADLTGQYDFLLYDNISVWGYDLSTQTAQELFAWSDSDINGYFVKKIGVLEDGRYFCAVEDWWYEDRCVVLLTKMKTEEAPQKENITLATVGGGKGLTIMVVRFNRGNNQYHLIMKNYDTLTDLYNALLAKEPIDLIDLSGVDVEKLSQQGVFADLAPLLEQSETLSSSDFLEGILDTYTFDGTLTGIPEAFSLLTVVGDKSLSGGSAGMTLDGLIAAAGQNPGALPYGEMTKEDIMRYLMMLNEDAFIDWNKGECHFDSEQFKEVLELVSRFPDSLKSGPEEASLPTKVQKGEVLMVLADLWRMDGYQLYEGICGGNAACIGFPTPDGQGGTLLFPRNAYGIVDGSKHKDGAWAFIEYILTRTDIGEMEAEDVFYSYLNYDTEVGTNGLPTQRRILDVMINYKIENDMRTSPVAFPGKSFSDGWFFQYHAMTMDDVNVILDLLKDAVPAFSVENDDIFNIIYEEAQAYYSGQKGIDDVTGIIQNRVQIYVDENNGTGGHSGSSAARGENGNGQNNVAGDPAGNVNGSGNGQGSMSGGAADSSNGGAEEQGDPTYYPNGRQVLTAAVTYPFFINDIVEQVRVFNESSPSYFVEIKSYDGFSRMDSVAKTAENLEAQIIPDILSGNGPDLVIWTGGYLQALVSEKYMVDLNGFMDADPDFHREDYFENILEALERNGALYIFPPSFSVRTMCGKAEELGTDKGFTEGWEFGEILEAFENSPHAVECFSYFNKRNTLQYMGDACMDIFVDWGSGECHFDTPEFVELLEWCCSLPDGFENIPDTYYEFYNSGKGLLYDVGLSDPWDMAEVRARFGDVDLLWTGIPVADGEKELGGGVVSPGRCISICRNSSSQEGAWEFIKSFLTPDSQREVGSNPILRSAFEEKLREALTVEYETINGTKREMVKYQVLLTEREGAVDFSCITEEDAEIYRRLIENAHRGYSRDSRIIEIILEEAEACFGGKKDAAAVAAVIQNRVSEYISERMR